LAYEVFESEKEERISEILLRNVDCLKGYNGEIFQLFIGIYKNICENSTFYVS